MTKKGVLFILLFAGFILLIFLLMQFAEVGYGWNLIAILFPKGSVALKERNLLFLIQAVMLLVVIPVYILTFVFSWKYRAQNKKAKYAPELDKNPIAEYIWWGIPCLIILVISIFTLIRTYQLDPYKALESHQKPLKIQVVALQWKWLFLYPEEKIASINLVPFPEKRPVHFEITADAPMNSFWIPQLGSQIYAMPKMKTQLQLIADEEGEYRGSSANLSGVGFAGMFFTAKAMQSQDFQKWVDFAKQSSHVLNWEQYHHLAEPSRDHPVTLYRLQDQNLFEQVIRKYTHPGED